MVGGAPQPGAICQMDESPSTSQSYTPQQEAASGASAGGEAGNGTAVVLSVAVHCPSCKDEFCGLCKKAVGLGFGLVLI